MKKKYLSEIINIFIYVGIVIMLVTSAINYGKSKATLKFLEEMQEVYINKLIEKQK